VTTNQLSGSIPTEIGNLSRLSRSQIYSENVLWHVDNRSQTSFLLLEVLGLGRNNLGRTIPTEIGRLRSLSTLGLERNSLTGPIPPEMSGMNTLSKFLPSRRTEGISSAGCLSPSIDALTPVSSPRFRTALFGL
jgi:hypothetical protein